MGINGAKGNMLNYSLDFVGGTSTTVTFKEDYSIADIDEKIVPVIEEVTGDPNVQTQKIEGSKQVVIKTRSLELSEREAVNQALIDKFGVDQDEIVAENISSTISSEMRSDAAWAVIIATICMLIYIWFRFKDIGGAGVLCDRTDFRGQYLYRLHADHCGLLDQCDHRNLRSYP